MARCPTVRRGVALFLLHVGMALATVALAAWMVRRTALDPERTGAVADAILDSSELRTEIADQVSERISQTTGQAAFEIEPTVDTLLQEDGVADALAATITAAHERLIDPSSPPVLIDASTMSLLSGGQVADQYELLVPTITALDTGRRAIDTWLPIVTFVAAAMAAVGVILHPNQPRALCQVGYWLVAASFVQVAVGWLVPVVIVPALTESAWADVLASAVRAYGETLVQTLAVVLGAGAAALLLGAYWGLAAHRDYDA